MSHHPIRRGLAATTLFGGLAGAGFVIATQAAASSSPSATRSSLAVSATPPPVGTLFVNNQVLVNTTRGVSSFDGTLYISSESSNVVLAENLSSFERGTNATGQIFAGTTSGSGVLGDGGLAVNATLGDPTGTAEDAAGNVYIADLQANRVRKVDINTGIITTVAGTGVAGNVQAKLATRSELNEPQAVAVNAEGDLFIADTGNNRVVEVFPSGVLRDFAGNGTHGYKGDGHQATAAELGSPTGVAVDSKGNVYIADTSNSVVRRVDARTRIITTVAGNFAADRANDGQGGFRGDGGPATSAQLNGPGGVALDSDGDLFIADTLNNAIREVTPDGTIFTVVNHAGANGAAPLRGPEVAGPAAASALNAPTGVGVDNSTATVVIADTSGNHTVAVTGLAQVGDAPGPVAPTHRS